MAKNLVPIGDEFQVNLVDPLPRNSPPLENGLIGFQASQAQAVLDNGNFVVVYQNDAGGKGDQDILSIEFKPNGTVANARDPFRVDFDAGDQVLPDVAPRIGGGYAAVWKEDVGNSIHMVAVTSSTPTNPPEFTVADFTDALDDPAIATFANGNYIVTYSRAVIGHTDDVWFAIVDKDATTRVVDNTGLVTTTDLDENSPAVATSGNLAAVAFVRGQDLAQIAISTVDSSGNGADFKIVTNVPAPNFLPDIAALSDGRFVIVWMQGGETFDVKGRIYDPATKDFSGPAFTISAGPDHEELPQVAALPDGGFVVTWTQIDVAETNGSILARRYDGTGAPAGDVFKLSDVASQFPTVAVNHSGRVFSTWVTAKNAHTTDPDIGIDGKLFLVATETVNGTKGNDKITTYSLSETINGLGGKDKIDGKGGNDIIDGGDGKDKLTGGPGFDTFVFDAKLKGKNADHITDFAPDVDRIRLDHDVFKKLKVGDLPGKAFFAHKHAEEGKNAKDLVVYDTKSGKLWYDKDGAGGAHAKLVAILDGSPHLGHGDIVIA